MEQVTEKQKVENEDNASMNNRETKETLGYKWWQFYSAVFTVLGLLFLYGFWSAFFNISEVGMTGEFIAAISISVAIMITWFIYLSLYNRYAFLLATVFSLNIFIWIGNGIYLKNRWRQSSRAYDEKQI